MDARTLSLCGVALKVECQASYQLSKIRNQWKRFFVLRDGSKLPVTIVYSFRESDLASDPVPPGIEVACSEHLLVLKTARGFYLRSGSSSLDIDEVNGRCQGVLSDEYWEQPLEYQREFFMLSFLMILRPFGLYGLHANGLLKNGSGYLIVGASESGKTTLSLALVHEGWGFIADDALMLKNTPQGIEALALRRGFSCTAQTASRYPELKATVDEAPAFLDGKKLVDIGQEYSNSFHLNCFPSVLLFPAITNETDSRLVPIEPTQSLVGLLEQSPGIMIEKQWVIEQMNVLKLLVNQSQCYQLLLGTDVYESPQAVAELLISITEESTWAE